MGPIQLTTLAFAERDSADSRPTPLIRGTILRKKEGAEMIVWNAGSTDQPGTGRGFAICTKCGYAEAETALGGQGRQGLSDQFKKHRPLTLNNRRCWGDEEAPALRNQVLFTRQTTDVIQIEVPDNMQLPGMQRPGAKAALAQALRLGGARLLQLDSRDIGAIIEQIPGRTSIVLYDNHPGGAGHVLELAENPAEWLRTRTEIT